MRTTTYANEAAARGDATASPCQLVGCGKWIASAGRGRPASFCSDDCREVSKLLARLSSHVERRAAAATDASQVSGLVSYLVREVVNPLHTRAAALRRVARAATALQDGSDILPGSAVQ